MGDFDRRCDQARKRSTGIPQALETKQEIYAAAVGIIWWVTVGELRCSRQDQSKATGEAVKNGILDKR